MRRALAFSLFLAACATSPSRYKEARMDPSLEHGQQLQEARDQLARDERELMGAGADSRPPDCQRARQLADNICGLAEHICALVARMPPDPAHANHCPDARARCKVARERVQARCSK